MILITDGTSFLGQAVVRRLVAYGQDVRCLLQPSRWELRLPPGLSLSTVSASLSDVPALRSSLLGVTSVIHLLSEWDIPHHKSGLDHPQDTANLIAAMQDVGVQRLVYVSRLGAESASGFPVFRIRGETEAVIRNSGIAATILQPAVFYGPNDGFISILAMLAKTVPLFLPLLDTGLSRFQPLWVEDLARCVAAALERDDLSGKTIALGGPEHMTLEQMATEVIQALDVQRLLLRTRFPVIRFASTLFDAFLRRNPIPLWMLDVLTLGSATDLGTVSRVFGFEPCRFSQCLDFVRTHTSWRRDFVRFVLRMS